MMVLSVVLISKNQEWNIARLIESVLQETSRLSDCEIVLVDSASTDKTTEIAARYPISVLKLHPDQRLTAAAGRYVGFQQTTGDLVLFLDGDMELYAGWLEKALAVIQSMPEVAVVCGKVIDRPKEFQSPGKETLNSGSDDIDPSGAAKSAVEVLHGGGAAVYRRSVLTQVGAFNPYLYSDEEPELCLRIRHAGYRVIRLSHPIAFHYTPLAEAFNTLWDRRSRKLWLGFGQILRYNYGSPLFWLYLKERGWVAGPFFALGAGISAFLISILAGQWIWLALWGAGVIILTLAMAFRKHSLKRAIFSLLQRMLLLDGTVRGLILKPYDPSSYPGRYDLIR
jgi:glycosyltransferase involved in cell wall biosynthesis